MKGIILAGGYGTRLFPVTKAINKHLIPVYDKPMIYYPLSILMLSNIREILIITNPEYLNLYKQLLGNGKDFGLKIDYKVQKEPGGIAEAFLIGEDFIEDKNVCLVLGDNIFYGQGFTNILENNTKNLKGAKIFGYFVNNPEKFGVVEFDENRKIISLQEKPKKPKSNYVVPGLYYFDNSVIKKSKKIKYSLRGELEITDINNEYLKEDNLEIIVLGRGFSWLDTGTFEGLNNANNFVKTIQERTGLYIACLEEIAFNKKWISKKELLCLIEKYGNTAYSKYLKKLL